MKKLYDRIFNYIKMEYEIFCFVESTESICNSKQYTIDMISKIKNKYKQTKP